MTGLGFKKKPQHVPVLYKLMKISYLCHEFAILAVENCSVTVDVAVIQFVTQFHLLSERFRKFPRHRGVIGCLVNLKK